jgi:hypothetical protein
MTSTEGNPRGVCRVKRWPLEDDLLGHRLLAFPNGHDGSPQAHSHGLFRNLFPKAEPVAILDGHPLTLRPSAPR